MDDRGGRAPSVALATLGCKLNQAETGDLMRKFLDRGFRIVEPDEVADVYVINTCTVTHIADRKSRQLIRQVRRLNPAAIVAATGCYVDVSPSEVQKIDNVDVIVANGDKHRIAELASERLGAASDGHADTTDQDLFGASGNLLASGRTRAFVKIEDGCNKFCSFCIVPIARGRERSLSVEDVVASVGEKVAAGHKEIVLTGVHLGTYGADLRGGESADDLNGLVRAVLERTDVARLRLSSIEPMDFRAEMLSIWSDERVCRHIHLPLQSGSDTVLKRMRRRYDTDGFAHVVERIRTVIPDVAITTDVIVGFPGETEAEFQEGYDFARRIGFAAIHVFKYSPRRGTIAATMPDQVPYEAKRVRSDAFLALSSESARSFAAKFVGRSLEVLYETTSETEGHMAWEGLTDSYLRVRTVSQRDLTNQVCRTMIVDCHDGYLSGLVESQPV
ncbi:MAG: tRNA (N(6)-L-threonylcarbamoyladenosine(37)-C(2))-methylthiotransferase MtaB [Chloroflexi bacterium]|nr:tRNA (N(6)-L-threonylcarbamoyladenosine(37)-C(2))-methylthiotransferase MtaB [Chloroflexota bacterium]